MTPLEFATKAHEGQVRKISGLPFITHPVRVAAILEGLGGISEEMMAAAFLHDTVEDVGLTVQEIRERFGSKVAMLVGGLTFPSSKMDPRCPREEKKFWDFSWLVLQPYEVHLIKLCDRLDNVRDMAGAGPKWQKKYYDDTLVLLDLIGYANISLSNLIREELYKWW